jgi:hypothetical protein
MVESAPVVNEDIIASLAAEYKPPHHEPPVTSVDTNGKGSSDTKAVSDPSPSTASHLPFDARIHQTNLDGSPKKNKDGSYRLKRGAKKKLANPATLAIPTDYAATGKLLTGMFFGVTESTFGDEWKPTPEENESITRETVRYCQARGFGDVPPGIALLLVVGMYAAPRLTKPKTLEKFTDWGLVRKKVVNHAQPDSGYDGIRENHPRQTPIPFPQGATANSNPIGTVIRPVVGRIPPVS